MNSNARCALLVPVQRCHAGVTANEAPFTLAASLVLVNDECVGQCACSEYDFGTATVPDGEPDDDDDKDDSVSPGNDDNDVVVEVDDKVGDDVNDDDDDGGGSGNNSSVTAPSMAAMVLALTGAARYTSYC